MDTRRKVENMTYLEFANEYKDNFTIHHKDYPGTLHDISKIDEKGKTITIRNNRTDDIGVHHISNVIRLIREKIWIIKKKNRL